MSKDKENLATAIKLLQKIYYDHENNDTRELSVSFNVSTPLGVEFMISPENYKRVAPTGEINFSLSLSLSGYADPIKEALKTINDEQ